MLVTFGPTLPPSQLVSLRSQIRGSRIMTSCRAT